MMPVQSQGRLLPRFSWKERYRGAWILGTVLGGVFIASCQSTDIKASKSHFLRPTDPPVHIAAGSDIVPEVVAEMKNGAEPGRRDEVYTITVTEMPVRDLLFALARDANKNIDVYPGITGRVTLSAIDQTLPQILDRVAKQVGIRYEIDGETVIVSPDRPYLKIYQVDYINVMRDSVSANKVSTQVSTSALTSSDLTGSDFNQSSSSLSTSSTNRFWRTLTQNIQMIIGSEKMSNNGMTSATSVAGGETGLGTGTASSVIPAAGAGDLLGSVVPPTGQATEEGGNPPAEGDHVGIAAINPEAGLISVYASSTQHERIQKYLDTVLDNVHRQVLIESTVVEVELSDAFQEGVDWNKVFNQAAGMTVSGAFSKMNPLDEPLDFFTIQHDGDTGSNGTISVALKVLETFGNTKVLSSPKIMALNNQAALLKVVKNEVFFTLESSASNNSNTTGTNTNTATAQIPVFNTKVHTVPVGLIMSVTPQVSSNDIVSLNVRPTISRIYDWKKDPNPALKRNTLTTGLEEDVESKIPLIEVKEMETLMRVHSGQVAVMGGLMQDVTAEDTNGLPVLGRMPGLGFLFGNQARLTKKSELVIFLRPVVMSQGKPRDTSMAQSPRKPRQMAAQSAQPVKPEQKPAQTPPSKDQPLQEKGGTPNQDKGNELTPPPAEPAGTGEAPAPAAALAPGDSYLDFTMPGGAVGMGGQNPAPAQRTPAAEMDRNITANFAPPPTQPALPPEVDEDPMLPMDYNDRQYDRHPGTLGQPVMAPGSGNVFLELGSFRQQALADNVQSQVSAIGLPIHREQAMVAGTSYQRVRSGPYRSRQEANQARDRISSLTGIQAKLASN
ncbi:MAG: pilus (MSHA type) biogenesis protein MshL [Magnetococcales bacterium]|nr:pilus (MSHA type) biogenesis protein MshL [Magnetococcales bacterium]MBF0150992.1 pilus (MSHA type) biogenesis protein MshL [Magnetococcales bacterium]MBF0173841.1 pilus (MSHA type) biogenesis protein MshL [Magnetococcales bacterium]